MTHRHRFLVITCVLINLLTALFFLISAIVRMTRQIDVLTIILLAISFVMVLVAMHHAKSLK